MLSFNKALQKDGILTYTQFGRVGYLQSGAISTLLTKKSSAEQLIDNYINILFRAAKAVDPWIIEEKTLDRWQRLKIYRISLVSYLGEEKM